MKTTSILLPILVFLFLSPARALTKIDSRNSVGYKMLEIERELGFDYTEENKTVLSELLDKASESIEIKDHYTKKEATQILETIDDLLKDYSYYAGNSLLSKALTNKQLDCNLHSFLYLHIAGSLNLPIYGVIIPEHMFVRWSEKDFNICWETTIGKQRSEQYYIDSMNVRPEPIKSGCYMNNIEPDNVIGFNIYELLPVNNSDLNDKFLQQAYKLIPEYSMLIYALGMNSYNQGKLHKAEELFLKAMKSDPYNVAAILMMTRIYCANSDFIEAKKYLKAAEREIIVLESRNDLSYKSVYYTVCGEYYRHQNMDDHAVNCYKKAIAFSKNNSEARRKLAALDSSFNNDQADLSNPVEIYNKLAEYFNGGKYDQALQYTEILIKMNFKIESVYYMKAGIQMNLKDTTNALLSYSKVINISKNDSYKFNSIYNRGIIYYQQNNYKKALPDFRAALEINDPAKDQLEESLRALIKDCKRRIGR